MRVSEMNEWMTSRGILNDVSCNQKGEKKRERKRADEKIFSWKRSKKSVHKGVKTFVCKYERIDEFKLSSFF